MTYPKITVKHVRRVDEFECVDDYYYATVHAPLGPVRLNAAGSEQAAIEKAKTWVLQQRASCP
jgi:hypothetical protein